MVIIITNIISIFIIIIIINIITIVIIFNKIDWNKSDKY